MSCRPQFPNSTPDGYQDKDFVHYYDQTNTPQLNNALSLAVGATILQIPLQLQGDAPFTLRGIKVNGPANFGIRIKDPYGNYLSDDFAPIPQEYGPEETPVFGSNVIDIEPEIPCPLGSIIFVDIKRLN